MCIMGKRRCVVLTNSEVAFLCVNLLHLMIVTGLQDDSSFIITRHISYAIKDLHKVVCLVNTIHPKVFMTRMQILIEVKNAGIFDVFY